MNENQIQTHMVKAFEKAGAWSSKWASQMLAGRPDLIAVTEEKTSFIEVKYLKALPTRLGHITVKLTPKQAQILNELYKKQPENVFVVVWCDMENSNYSAQVVKGPFEPSFKLESKNFFDSPYWKKRGKGWPVMEIIGAK